MDLVNNETGKVESVPAEQAGQAFLSGTHGVAKDQIIHGLRSDGSVDVLPAEHLQAFLQKGGKLASDEEARKYQLDQKYGGIGSTLAAGGEGFARGITVGLSDPLAVGAARMFAGDKAAEAVRTNLSENKETHPILSTGTEIIGALAPTLATGGAAAPEEAAAMAAGRGGLGLAEGAGAAAEAGMGATTALKGAEAVSEGSRMLGSVGSGLRTLGSLPRGIEALGEGTEHILGHILGDTASSIIGRAAQSAAKGAARSMVEGGLWSAGAEISDATLKDVDLTTEKLLSTISHGALLAGALGGALSGLGSLAGSGLGRMIDKTGQATLDDAAGEQAYKSLSASKAEARAAARHGGPAEVGQTYLDEVIRPAVEKGGLKAAAMDAGEKLEATQAAMDRVGKSIQEKIVGTPAEVSAADILKPFEAAAKTASTSGKSLAENVPERLGKVREKFAEALGIDMTAPLEGQMVPAADLIAQRRELQKMAKFQLATPSEPIEHFRAISGQWNELEEKALNNASETLGNTPAGTELRDLNRTYGQLASIERTLSRQATGEITRPILGLKDILMGGGIHSASALLSGHPLTALAGIGGSFAHRAVAEHGNTYAALMLDRLASMGAVSEAAHHVDQTIDQALAVFMSEKGRTIGLEHSKMSLDRYEHEESRVRSIAALAPAVIAAHVQDTSGSLNTHLPAVAKALQQQAVSNAKYLSSKLPPAPSADAPASLTPQLDKQKVSDPIKASFLRSVRAVDGGPAGVAKRLANNTISAEDVDWLKSEAPKSYQEMREKIMVKCAQRTKPLDYEQRKRLGILFDLPTDPTLAPDFVTVMQEHFTKGAPQGQGPQAAQSPHAVPAKVASLKNMATPTERAQGAA